MKAIGLALALLATPVQAKDICDLVQNVRNVQREGFLAGVTLADSLDLQARINRRSGLETTEFDRHVTIWAYENHKLDAETFASESKTDCESVVRTLYALAIKPRRQEVRP